MYLRQLCSIYVGNERASERGRHLDIGSKSFHGIDLCLSDFCM